MSKKRWLAAVAVASFCLCPLDLARAVDGDTDDDTIPDSEEPGDTDGDGLDDFEDADDDNDGVDTLIELQRAPASGDTDGDGVRDYLDLDDDGDGLDTPLELGPLLTPLDTDTDGKPNYLDSDDDGDGELTIVERASAPPEPDVNGNQIPDYLDAAAFGSQAPPVGCQRVSFKGGTLVLCDDQDQDGDGVLSRFEATSTVVLDTDNDGVADFMDADDDGDGISSRDEGCDPNGDGNPDDALQTGQNTVNYLLADDDEDSVPTRDERPGNVDRDTDSDGKPDQRDIDDDGDGVDTLIEVGNDPAHPLDTNMDGVPDYLQAGVKAGLPGSGADSGASARQDAGVVGSADAGVPLDAGTSNDAGSAGSDGGTRDAAVSGDVGTDSDADAEEESPGSAGKSSGCSALPAKSRGGEWLLTLAAGLGLVWLKRRRARSAG